MHKFTLARALFVGLLFLVAPVVASAQDKETPKFDLFVGGSVLQDDFNSHYKTLGGVHVAGTYNFNDVFGIESEVAVHGGDHTHVSITAGPRFTARGERVTGFGHALFGVVGGSSDLGQLQMNFGGGVDVKLNDRFDLRVIQADWVRIGVDNTANDARISAGIVVKF